MTKKKILIVEDDPQSLRILSSALLQAGYEIQSAISAQEALFEVNRFKPHLVLTDQDMPGITGIEMLRELRLQKNYVTVIFISGQTDPELIAQALRAGADDYIRKPFNVEELLARIETTLRTNELHKELFEANERLQEMVEADYLTGLFNMRSMYEKIDYELKRAKRFKRSISCVMLDMDHFKRVNDTNDHLFGSFVLKEVGKVIQATMREIDFAARYGGDEFLVVLTEADGKGAEAFCERLRKNIENEVFTDGENSIKLTVSLGYSVYKGGDEIDARALVRKADHALYEAKARGRNQFYGYA